jgi:hypothetical protein
MPWVHAAQLVPEAYIEQITAAAEVFASAKEEIAETALINATQRQSDERKDSIPPPMVGTVVAPPLLRKSQSPSGAPSALVVPLSPRARAIEPSPPPPPSQPPKEQTPKYSEELDIPWQ